MSWLDAPILYLCFGTSFCPRAGLKEVPLFGTIAQALNCIFIPRGGKEEVRQQTVEMIGARQKLAEQDPSVPKLMIFPEGGTSNGTGIIKFKRGAFEAERAVKPVFMKFDWSYCSPAYTLGFIPLMVL